MLYTADYLHEGLIDSPVKATEICYLDAEFNIWIGYSIFKVQNVNGNDHKY